ncbi:DUF1553 domain-containing protein [Gimesia panareensis]|uniref:DUF1553 domain-containing protein n=1 Tax=Gimesia panareensis TaxID=2527978 RepID=UPI001189DD05|nr:DUF1553 domain-containing protein [Gimesia panareensis]QDU50234.1 Planctomycete cytochrome C [Gimesia panareensis]
MRRLHFPGLVCAASLLWLFLFGQICASGAEIEFNRDVRPILSDLCFQCHGPDSSQRQADLRLDQEAGLLGAAGETGAVVPGKAAESELFKRLLANDPDLQMPPASSEKQITAEQIETIKRWINSGARWQKHWAFIPPQRPAVPQVKNQAWVRNPIDAFVLARLEREGLAPSPEADQSTLIRRLSLDLTGLPPALPAQKEFFEDESPQAYERLVDRLLASPHYGERMALEWLDAARFADTSGYQTDGERHMWRWREWVIDAFNSNKPFDQFTVEQLAGDLLPNPSLDQLVATGFNRNHRANSEGGIIFDEYLLEYAVDRVETTGTVWLGLTVGCARCHEHKYDPISQKEFYQLIAFFNNIPERGRAIKYGNAAPFVTAPTKEQQQTLNNLDQEIKSLEQKLQDAAPELKRLQKQWEQTHPAAALELKYPQRKLAYRIDFNGDLKLQVIGKQQLDFYANRTNASSDVELYGQDESTGKAQFEPADEGQALHLDGTEKHEAKELKLNGKKPMHVNGDAKPILSDKDPFSMVFRVKPEQPHGTILASLTPQQDESGFRIFLKKGRLHINMGPRWLDDAILLESTGKLKLNDWSHVVLTYAGNSQARGFQLYVNGEPQELKAKLNYLTGGFAFPAPFVFGAYHDRDYFRGLIDDFRIYRTRLTSDWVALDRVSQSVPQILTIPADQRSAGQQQKVQLYFMTYQAPTEYRLPFFNLRTLREKRNALTRSLPTSMVMRERKAHKPTFVLMRGEYDKPGEPVTAGIPASLGALPEDLPRNRLGLARWLVDPANPLTARVVVNRYWQMYFGNGLVKTTEDFGSQGSWPTHPELLDWLATEFIRTGWDVKRLQKLIVTSATYRQSSHVTSELLKVDPENQLLARAGRLRLSAEMIRDQALFVSGLLRPEIGGPSVKPYQPQGVWKEIASQTYEPGTGDDLYRRSMYTYWKRTVPPPAMATFDAPTRETCIVKRSRTNTPLQALALLNDVTYVEASRKLAERMLNLKTEEPAERIRFAMRVVLAREPSEREREIFLKGWERYRNRFEQQPEAARQYLDVGESRPAKRYDPAEHAAYTVIASLILNLDETINRE